MESCVRPSYPYTDYMSNKSGNKFKQFDSAQYIGHMIIILTIGLGGPGNDMKYFFLFYRTYYVLSY